MKGDVGIKGEGGSRIYVDAGRTDMTGASVRPTRREMTGRDPFAPAFPPAARFTPPCRKCGLPLIPSDNGCPRCRGAHW